MHDFHTHKAQMNTEIAAITSILNQKYSGEFKLTVPPASVHIVTKEGANIVATIGIEMSEDGKLPFEHYLFVHDERFNKLRRFGLAEFTRWVSTSHRAGAHVVLGAAQYVRDQHAQTVAFSVKRRQIQYLQRMKLPFSVMQAEIADDVPHELQSYYYDSTNPPQVLVADVNDIYNTFQKALYH